MGEERRLSRPLESKNKSGRQGSGGLELNEREQGRKNRAIDIGSNNKRIGVARNESHTQRKRFSANGESLEPTKFERERVINLHRGERGIENEKEGKKLFEE